MVVCNTMHACVPVCSTLIGSVLIEPPTCLHKWLHRSYRNVFTSICPLTHRLSVAGNLFGVSVSDSSMFVTSEAHTLHIVTQAKPDRHTSIVICIVSRCASLQSAVCGQINLPGDRLIALAAIPQLISQWSSQSCK